MRLDESGRSCVRNMLSLVLFLPSWLAKPQSCLGYLAFLCYWKMNKDLNSATPSLIICQYVYPLFTKIQNKYSNKRSSFDEAKSITNLNEKLCHLDLQQAIFEISDI